MGSWFGYCDDDKGGGGGGGAVSTTIHHLIIFSVDKLVRRYIYRDTPARRHILSYRGIILK
jgi:hypothetical protein